jgi:ABC transporter substrate binding protein
VPSAYARIGRLELLKEMDRDCRESKSTEMKKHRSRLLDLRSMKVGEVSRYVGLVAARHIHPATSISTGAPPYYVDKILRGVKATDLPVEQPTKLGLVVNLKTAQPIGLTIPQSVLYRADGMLKCKSTIGRTR